MYMYMHMDVHGMLHAYGTLYMHVYGVLPVHGMLHRHVTNIHVPYTWITPVLRSVASTVLMHSLESVCRDRSMIVALGLKHLTMDLEFTGSHFTSHHWKKITT